MKASAPEKIYLEREIETDRIQNVWGTAPVISSLFEHIEYISKDAFIEKTCVKLKKLMYDNLMFQGRLHREEIIENFVGELRNYMKEE